MTPAAAPWRLDELEFFEEGHRYLVRGKEIPSVTTLMRKHGIGFQGFAPQQALDRGHYVHGASVMIDEGDFDWQSCPKDWMGYCLAYSNARAAEPDIRVVEAEARFWHPEYWYAGTLDRVIFVVNDGKLRVRELKTGDASDVECQVAAYVHARKRWHPHTVIDERVGECLKVNDDGTFRLFEIDLLDGWRGFSACLVLEERMRRKGRRDREAA